MEETDADTLTAADAGVTDPHKTGPLVVSWGLQLHPKSIMERSGQGEKDVGKTQSELGFGESVGLAYMGRQNGATMSVNASFCPCHTEWQGRLEPGCED